MRNPKVLFPIWKEAHPAAGEICMSALGWTSWPRIVALVPLCLLATGPRLCAQAAPVHPAWWASQGVLTGTSSNDLAAVTRSHAKEVALGAIHELDLDLTEFGGAGYELDQLVNSLTATPTQGSDTAAIRLGRLKALVQPIYDRLLSLGYTLDPLSTGTYPWVDNHQVTNDSATVNLGQLKHFFSFDLTFSSAPDGLPDWWVKKYFGKAAVSGTSIRANAFVPWSFGTMTYLQSYKMGLNPIDFYNRRTPLLKVVSGARQTGSAGGFVPFPLVVSVADGGGKPLFGAPITFRVSSGRGLLQSSSTGTSAGALTAFADENGQAQVFFKLPAVVSSTSEVIVTTGSSSCPAQVTFTEISDDGSGAYMSPFTPTNVLGNMNADGSERITWQNNDSSSRIYIYEQLHDGSWKVLISLPPGTTTYTAPASAVSTVEVGNDFSPGGSTGKTGDKK